MQASAAASTSMSETSPHLEVEKSGHCGKIGPRSEVAGTRGAYRFSRSSRQAPGACCDRPRHAGPHAFSPGRCDPVRANPPAPPSAVPAGLNLVVRQPSDESLGYCRSPLRGRGKPGGDLHRRASGLRRCGAPSRARHLRGGGATVGEGAWSGPRAPGRTGLRRTRATGTPDRANANAPPGRVETF